MNLCPFSEPTMAPKKKSRTCKICRLKFSRPYNLTEHMKTEHNQKVKKLICPECGTLIGTISNIVVHMRRIHHIRVKAENKKINGRRIKHKYVDKKALKNGRYISEPDSSSSDSEFELPLNELKKRLPPVNILEPDVIIAESEWTDPIDQYEYSSYDHNDVSHCR